MTPVDGHRPLSPATGYGFGMGFRAGRRTSKVIIRSPVLYLPDCWSTPSPETEGLSAQSRAGIPLGQLEAASGPFPCRNRIGPYKQTTTSCGCAVIELVLFRLSAAATSRFGAAVEAVNGLLTDHPDPEQRQDLVFAV